MASKSKLQKFAELASNPIVLEKNPAVKGKWNTEFFKNQHPIVLELACGKGDYTLGMAKLFPDKNFIGADIKGNRIWSAARIAEMENLHNVIEKNPHDTVAKIYLDRTKQYLSSGVSETWEAVETMSEK